MTTAAGWKTWALVWMAVSLIAAGLCYHFLDAKLYGPAAFHALVSILSALKSAAAEIIGGRG